MTGSEVLDREHYQLEQHCLWWRRRRHDVALQCDMKKYFLYAILTTGLFHIMLLTNRPNFWVRDISWARLFPEASFPQLSISPWCLKRGTTAVLLRPFREDSAANPSALKLTEAANCDVSRYHPLDDETHTHCTERVNSNTFICQNVSSAALCLCAAASPHRHHPPHPRIIFVHLPATPMEHSKNGCWAIYLNFPNLLTFFVWPASPRARSLKTVVVQQLW